MTSTNTTLIGTLCRNSNQLTTNDLNRSLFLILTFSFVANLFDINDKAIIQYVEGKRRVFSFYHYDSISLCNYYVQGYSLTVWTQIVDSHRLYNMSTCILVDVHCLVAISKMKDMYNKMHIEKLETTIIKLINHSCIVHLYHIYVTYSNNVHHVTNN